MWKRLTLSIGGVAVIISLVAGATFALFTASTNNSNNSFVSGTVSLDAPVSTLVDVPTMVPGDSGAKTYSVKYTGNVPAWVSLDATLSPTSIDSDLVDCDPGKFVVAVSHGGPAAAMSTGNYSLLEIFPTSVNPGDTSSFDITYNLDKSAGNACQSKSARLVLTGRAVQSAHNTSNGSPNSFGLCTDHSDTWAGGACALAVGGSLSDTVGDMTFSNNGQTSGYDVYKIHFTAGPHTVTLLTPGDKLALQSPDYGFAVPTGGQAHFNLDIPSEGDYYFAALSIWDQGGGSFTISAS